MNHSSMPDEKVYSDNKIYYSKGGESSISTNAISASPYKTSIKTYYI